MERGDDGKKKEAGRMVISSFQVGGGNIELFRKAIQMAGWS